MHLNDGAATVLPGSCRTTFDLCVASTAATAVAAVAKMGVCTGRRPSAAAVLAGWQSTNMKKKVSLQFPTMSESAFCFCSFDEQKK